VHGQASSFTEGEVFDDKNILKKLLGRKLTGSAKWWDVLG